MGNKFFWIFDSDALWTLIPLCSLLWAWGGSGPKPFRKIGVPGAICLAALSLKVAWWLILLTAGSMFVLMTIPYGSRIKGELGLPFYWIWLYFVAGLYAAALLPLAFVHGHWLYYGIGCAISALVFGILTYTSQVYKWPTWKWVEMALGACIGLQAAWLM